MRSSIAYRALRAPLLTPQYQVGAVAPCEDEDRRNRGRRGNGTSPRLIPGAG